MATSEEKRLTAGCRRVLSRADAEAATRGDPGAGAAHVLLALLAQRSEIGVQLLAELCPDLQDVRDRAESALELERGDRGRAGAASQFDRASILAKAAIEARSAGHFFIGTEHLLLALLTRPDTYLCKTLKPLNITYQRLRAVFLDLWSSPAEESELPAWACAELPRLALEDFPERYHTNEDVLLILEGDGLLTEHEYRCSEHVRFVIGTKPTTEADFRKRLVAHIVDLVSLLGDEYSK